MLLTISDRGIYCQQADVYIDPWKSVKRALITHAHSDHARRGHQNYLAQHDTAIIVKHRIKGSNVQGIDFGETIHINGVNFSFHPAGHIIGSAQIRAEYKGNVEVASGDYKIHNDGISGQFETIKCHHFITESTFGLPVFQWKNQNLVYEEINNWWAKNRQEKKLSILTAYSLGKAQRLLHHLDPSIGRIFTHSSIHQINELFRSQGHQLIETDLLHNKLTSAELMGNILLAPSSTINSKAISQIRDKSIGTASGWMATRNNRKRRSADIGFVLSDHADWNGLNEAIKSTEANTVTVTHGYTASYARWLSENGIRALTAETEYTGEAPPEIPKAE